MKTTDPILPSLPQSSTKLLSIVLLATGMLLASTMTLKASWLWVLGPVGLLALLDLKAAGAAAKLNLSCLPFYAGLLGVAMAFNFAGLPPTSTPARPAMAAAGGCGSGGCGTAAGCGSGSCGASSGGGCGCSSKKTATAKTAASSDKGSSTPASSSASNKPKVTGGPSRPVTTTPPNRPNIQLPLPPRATPTRPPTPVPPPTPPASTAVAPTSAPKLPPAAAEPGNASPAPPSATTQPQGSVPAQ